MQRNTPPSVSELVPGGARPYVIDKVGILVPLGCKTSSNI